MCDTNLPWIADNVRENGGENRDKLQQRYMNEIEKKQFRYKLVKGTGKIRTQNRNNFV